MPDPKPKRRKKSRGPIVLAVCIVLLAAAAAVAVWAQNRSLPPVVSSSAAAPSYVVRGNSAAQSASSSAPATSSGATAEPAASLPGEMRAMWISYLEWLKNDISTEEKLREVLQRMFGECRAMGLNTVMVQVRPFGDALYPSKIFPWSHHLTGEQGKDPGYDPLAVMVEEAHAEGLRLEAWVNPYRVNLPGEDGPGPEELADTNPAVLHPEWVREVEGVGTFYDPGIPEVQAMIVEGLTEIAQNYEVDGIHLDDYFYPAFSAEQRGAGEDEAFDAETYAQYGAGQDLAAWRRENVNALVKAAYGAIKGANPALSFGISPQGNNDNNYNQQYSDVKLWLSTPGYCDYVMPQLYWGFNYRLQNGSDRFAFENIAREWAAYPRSDAVRLYAGLGAYRIEDGDGSDETEEEWNSGHNLADMVSALRGIEGFSGFALFRYEVLYGSGASPLAAQEIAALTEVLAEGGAETGAASGSSSLAAASSQQE